MTTLASSLAWQSGGVSVAGDEDDVTVLGDDEPGVVRTLKGHRGSVHSVAFSAQRDGTALASGGADACVMLWQFAAASKKRPTRAYRFAGHTAAVHKVTFSPDGSVLASASADRTVRLWQPTARGHSVELKGCAGGVRCVDFSGDGRRLLTASDDKSVKVWALPSRKFVCTLGVGSKDAHAHWVRAAKWAPDGRVCASGGDDKLVKLWDVERNACSRTFFEHEGCVRDVAFSTDGTCVVSGGDDRKINVWDARSRTLLQHYAAHAAGEWPCFWGYAARRISAVVGVSSLAFDSTGHYLMSASDDATIKLYDLREGALLYTLQGHSGGVGCVACDPRGGGLFASGGADRVVTMWRANLDGAAPTPRNAPVRPPLRGVNHAAAAQPAASPFEPQRPPPTVPPSCAAAAARAPRAPPPPPALVIEELAQAAAPGEARAPFAARGGAPPAALGGAPRGVDRGMLPEVLATTLDHIVGQLDIITTTLAAFEQRLSITEERVATILGVGPETYRGPATDDWHAPPAAADPML
ncbi:WD40-repeat-containing domain protein [Pelagophyceae sp. CCMP2097]|nr:WD40-repeat-containing domain protein [Pelagophyceae sp. CCMP2097]